MLEVLHPSIDDNNQFIESYGRPIYTIRNMTGKPFSFLRLGYPEVGEEFFDIEYENSTNVFSIEDIPVHKHNEPISYEDDDFFRENSKVNGAKFDDLLKNYTFALYYTGMRWYGELAVCSVLKNIVERGY